MDTTVLPMKMVFGSGRRYVRAQGPQGCRGYQEKEKTAQPPSGQAVGRHDPPTGERLASHTTGNGTEPITPGGGLLGLPWAPGRLGKDWVLGVMVCSAVCWWCENVSLVAPLKSLGDAEPIIGNPGNAHDKREKLENGLPIQHSSKGHCRVPSSCHPAGEQDTGSHFQHQSEVQQPAWAASEVHHI